MNRQAIGRLLSVLVGAGVLFELEHGYRLQLYIAIPVAIVAYLVVKVAVGLLWGTSDKPT